MIRILGIDPGLGTTGYGIIEDRTFRVIEAGVIRTRARTPIQERIKVIFDEISDIIREHEPSVLVLEKIYSHYKHPTTAILMGHARAMACLVCGKLGVKLVSYPSTKIKKAITGNGHASKTQVQRMVQDILKLNKAPEPADVSDALAMAISYCYIEKHQGEQA
jgi:crossover junction endodeoxyribonuclease RuvC